MKYVLIGCKGSGVASLCHILLDQGHEVIGIDNLNYNYPEDDLRKRNMKIYNFNEYQYETIDIVIYGHSFKESNELKRAKEVVNLIYEYHEFVKLIASKSKLNIAVSGSHGKTYTTGLLSFLLSNINNISYLIGDGEGKYNGDDIFVYEACEYQDHFLIYESDISIILNIDYDHVDYFKKEEDYINTFKKFINNSKVVIANKNDEIISKLDNEKIIYYDINETKDLRLEKNGYTFSLNDEKIITNVYGIKHVENILAVIKLLDYLGIEKKRYLNNLNKNFGVKRRFRETIINGDIYIDDYAHHPSQIKYTLDMIKNKYPDYGLIVFFKPDRESRFLTFYKQIATSLEKADYAVIMETNSCFEKIDVSLLIKESNKFYEYNREIIEKIKKINKKVVVTLSSKNMQEVYENIFINTHL